ncbi:MAG: hypothetical protein RIR76_1196, partial [Verrucomicrobiota bacterium]
MKRFPSALLLALACFAPISVGAADAILTGQVSNAATRAFLEGASVSVAGTARSAVTDREG